MTTPDPLERGLDPAHVLTLISRAAQDQPRQVALAVAAPDGLRVCFRSGRAATNACAALSKVGYQVTRLDGSGHRNLLVTGWSPEGLESRLGAMRTVLQRLSGEPGATAAAALDPLGRIPAAALPGRDGQRRLIRQASNRLRTWISATSGIHAPYDPGAWPADLGCALRLGATRRAEKLIDDLAVRHLKVTALAVTLYPSLREQMTHDVARNTAVRRAEVAFHLSGQLGQDLTPLLRNADRSPRPASSPSSAPAATSARARAGAGSRPSFRSSQEFPATDRPVSPTSRPPSTRGATRPRGRPFPSSNPGRRR
jgi:hypothetical protein